MKQSAGIMLYRQSAKGIEVLLVHPGGPFWAKKDAGAWSIPKGEIIDGEDGLTAAKREFMEELGSNPPHVNYMQLEPVKQSSKVVHAWLAESDFDVSSVVSNRISLDWPPKSGVQIEVPEVDKANWFVLNKARTRLVKGQVALIDQLTEILGNSTVSTGDKPEEQAQISLF